MPHYETSRRLRTIANIWGKWTGDEADTRHYLDGDGDKFKRLCDAGDVLVEAMQALALPDEIELHHEHPWPTGDVDGTHCHKVLGLMADLEADDDAEEFWFPVGRFCERYGLESRTVELSDDDTETGKACQLLDAQGWGNEGILRVWHPPYEPGEFCILRQYGEDGPYAVFARHKVAEPEAP